MSATKSLKRSVNICLLTTALVLLAINVRHLSAEPTTPQQAELAVLGWLATDATPLGAILAADVKNVQTFTDSNQKPLYYIVYLRPRGFVIVPADDLVEPIVGLPSAASIILRPRIPWEHW